MKLPVLAVLGAALLLSACAKKEAQACASPDVKDQLMRIFLQGAITERSPEFKDSALRDVAILEKDPDSGVLSLSLIHIFRKRHARPGATGLNPRRG